MKKKVIAGFFIHVRDRLKDRPFSRRKEKKCRKKSPLFSGLKPESQSDNWGVKHSPYSIKNTLILGIKNYKDKKKIKQSLNTPNVIYLTILKFDRRGGCSINIIHKVANFETAPFHLSTLLLQSSIFYLN